MMRRLKVFIFIFLVAMIVPLGYLIWTTLQGLEHEERAEMAFFAGTLFAQIEDELASFIQHEENRSVEEYNVLLLGNGATAPASAPDYVLGYLQNNPDGSFQPPLHVLINQDHLPQLASETEEVNDQITMRMSQTTVVVRSGPDGQDTVYAQIQVGQDGVSPDEFKDREVMSQLEALLSRLRDADMDYENRNRLDKETLPQDDPANAPGADADAAEQESQQQASVAERYLDMSEQQAPRPSLGRQEGRVEQIPADSLNITIHNHIFFDEGPESDFGAGVQSRPEPVASAESGTAADEQLAPVIERDLDPEPVEPGSNALFEVEVAPYQSVFINEELVYMFRRIVIDNTIYRQGFVIKIRDLLEHLVNRHFAGQPMAGFAGLRLTAEHEGRQVLSVSSGAPAVKPSFVLNRSFPRPFDFLSATLSGDTLPRSPGRAQLSAMVALLAAIIMLGLFTIYKSARVVMDHSARRSGFVSSVTHELKTPLTNIRMYVEMLEMGMARDPDREQEYLRIVSSESARLSRLINNVLEFSRLENNHRKVELTEGDFRDVLGEVQEVMREKVRQDGFALHVDVSREKPFMYNAEIMTQVLINLVENSLKFGKHSPVREIAIRVADEGEDKVLIAVVDSGPGIPKDSLSRIFDDFYRVDDSLTRRTRGTGIGLALVRKLVQAMGGEVKATNNNGPGCTISIVLPE